jgi:hypothetical protein
MNLRYKMTLNHKFSLEKNNIGQDSNFRFKKWKTIHLQSILVPRTFYPIWLKYTITKVNYLWSDTNMLTSGMKLRRSWVSASFRSRIQTVSATCVLFLLFTSPLVLSSTFLYLDLKSFYTSNSYIFSFLYHCQNFYRTVYICNTPA